MKVIEEYVKGKPVEVSTTNFKSVMTQTVNALIDGKITGFEVNDDRGGTGTFIVTRTKLVKS